MTIHVVEKALWDAWARGAKLTPERMAFMEALDTALDVPGTKVRLIRRGKVVDTLVSDGKALETLCDAPA